MTRDETALRQRVVKALAPTIGVEPVESGAVNPGFPDVLLSIFGADGLIPVELKVGKLRAMDGRVSIEYRADQMAKNYDLRRRIRFAWTLIYVTELKRYFLIRDYRAGWALADLEIQSKWVGDELKPLKTFLVELINDRNRSRNVVSD